MTSVCPAPPRAERLDEFIDAVRRSQSWYLWAGFEGDLAPRWPEIVVALCNKRHTYGALIRRDDGEMAFAEFDDPNARFQFVYRQAGQARP